VTFEPFSKPALQLFLWERLQLAGMRDSWRFRGIPTVGLLAPQFVALNFFHGRIRKRYLSLQQTLQDKELKK
jgi:hypothetical protein